MATILDLFRSTQKEVYGKVDNIRINSRGFINPPRGAALLASSPNAVADLIGNQISGVLKGSANRPSDTIFKNNTPFSKPISLGKTISGLRNAVDADKKDYYIKDAPSPASVVAKIKQGGSTTAGVVANIGIGAINKFGSKKGLKDLKDYKNKLLGKGKNSEGYGTKYQRTDLGNKPLSETKIFTKYYPTYTEVNSAIAGNKKWWEQTGTLERSGKKSWDESHYSGSNTEKYADEKAYQDAVKLNKDNGSVWVSFKKYGTNEVIPFAGVLSGISEDISPEWNAFKYVGSPFNVYRYGGVERSLKFDLKLYYTTAGERDIMIKKINFLKSLTFPYDEVSSIKYGDTETALAFSPNLVYLGIDGLYKNVLGYVESLSFTIDDNTSWSNTNPNLEANGDNTIYPSVIDVSFGMKIIEKPTIEVKDTITKYRYNFDGIHSGDKYEIGLTKDKG